jgi:hypothetical protein
VIKPDPPPVSAYSRARPNTPASIPISSGLACFQAGIGQISSLFATPDAGRFTTDVIIAANKKQADSLIFSPKKILPPVSQAARRDKTILASFIFCMKVGADLK